MYNLDNTSLTTQQKISIQQEFTGWRTYIKDILTKYNSKIYIKGGAILGLQCLKLSIEHCNNNNFEQHFNNFKQKLGFVIKDWDFVLVCPDCNTKDFYTSNIDFNKEGETIIVMRYKTQSNRILINSEALFEMAIRNVYDPLSELEMPLSSMKVSITLDNYDMLFTLMERLYLHKQYNLPIDFDYLVNTLKNVDIIIDDHDENGLFNVNYNNYHDANLSNEMLQCIKSVSNNNLNIEQFLISQIKEPDRLFFRLFEKNIPKSIKIKEYFNNNNIGWLPNTKFIDEIVNKFISILKDNVNNIYQKHYQNMKSEYDNISNIETKISILQCKLVMLEIRNKTIDNTTLTFETCIDELANYIQQKYNFDKDWTYTSMKNLPEVSSITNIPNNAINVFTILSPLIKNINILNSMQLPSLCSKIAEFKEHLQFSVNHHDELSSINNDIKFVKDNITMEKKNKNKHVMLIRILYRKMFNELNILFDYPINIGRLKDAINKFDIIMIDKLKDIFSSVINSSVVNIGLLDNKLYDGYRIHDFVQVLKTNDIYL
jgi:hypothetical protein